MHRGNLLWVENMGEKEEFSLRFHDFCHEAHHEAKAPSQGLKVAMQATLQTNHDRSCLRRHELEVLAWGTEFLDWVTV